MKKVKFSKNKFFDESADRANREKKARGSEGAIERRNRPRSESARRIGRDGSGGRSGARARQDKGRAGIVRLSGFSGLWGSQGTIIYQDR
jgi:hypothetical protein